MGRQMRKVIFSFLIFTIIFAAFGCKAIPKKVETPSTEAGKEVIFFTADGVSLRGYIFGKGKIGVILSHMYPADQTSWFDTARTLAQKGYQVLTFDFRGYGKSEGQKEISLIDQDLTTALYFMKNKRKTKRIFLVGASMGGTASLKVAASNEVTGVISLSGPIEFQGLTVSEEIPRIKTPKLFIASEGDAPAVQASQQLFEQTPEPREIKIFTGNEHGTDILKGPHATEAEALILDFLKRYK